VALFRSDPEPLFTSSSKHVAIRRVVPVPPALARMVAPVGAIISSGGSAGSLTLRRTR
jgi:hypothetical protein